MRLFSKNVTNISLKLASNSRHSGNFTSWSKCNEHKRIDLVLYYNDTAIDGLSTVIDTVNSIFILNLSIVSNINLTVIHKQILFQNCKLFDINLCKVNMLPNALENYCINYLFLIKF